MHYIFGPCTVELNNILISLTHGKSKFGYFDIYTLCSKFKNSVFM
jgi:hypothetical protein